MAIGRGHASPSDFAIRPVGEAREPGSFTFLVDAAGLSVAGDPQSARFTLPGFDSVLKPPGAPDLPEKMVRIAIPPGVVPRLEVHADPDVLTPAFRPQAVERSVREWVEEGDDEVVALEGGKRSGFAERAAERKSSVVRERVENASIYEGDGLYPAQVAWLGAIGTLRGQRYVEVHLAPVRYDPILPGVRVTPSYEVTVRFEGDTGARATPTPELVFEDVYRNAFVNYAQGTTFRIGAVASAETRTSAAAPELTAGTDPYKIRVRSNGIVRIDASRVAGTAYATAPLSTWKLTNRGSEVPLDVQDDGDDVLEPGEHAQFWGQALDDEPKSILNLEVPDSNQDLWEARDFTDENVYFLTIEAGSRSRIATLPSAPTNTRTPPTDFEATVHAEVDNLFRPLGSADPWYWSPTICITGCSGGAVATRSNTVPLPGLASGTAPLQATVRVRGASESATVYPDHKSRVTLLNSSASPLTTNDDDGTFDGRTLYTHSFPWTYPGSGAQATDPLSVQLEVLASGAPNMAVLDWIDVRYRRAFTAVSDQLVFDWPDGDAEFIVSGLQSAAPAVWETTRRVGASPVVLPVRLTGGTVSGAGPYSIRFRVDEDPSIADGTLRRFVVAGDAATTIPASQDFQADLVSDLRNTSNQADLIVIASATVLDDSPGSTVANFLTHRGTQGISSKVVLISDVEDEFNDGLPGPLAVKRFLEWVMSTAPGEGWALPKPIYVLLIGDGSYDYKGGLASGNYVPTQLMFKDAPELGYYASDNLMANVVGSDQLADLVVGRIAARSITETNRVLLKVLNYDAAPAGGNWRHSMLFISDRGHNYDPNEALDFESVNADSEAMVPRPPYVSTNLRYWSDFGGVDPDGMRLAIRNTVNGDGVALAQYIGHGNFDIWSDDAFFDDFHVPRDTSFLTNDTRLPWLLAHNCLTGGFHTTSLTSLGEDWVMRDIGGAIALFAPSGLSYNYIGAAVADSVWGDLFGKHKQRAIAVPVLNAITALCGQGSIESCQGYVLLGDPTLTLGLPNVAPATSVAAVPSSMRVDLSWTASLTPGATYNVYRATLLTPPNYGTQPLNGSPIAGTTFADTTAVNAATYYYYVVAKDAPGFESRWSNFNSDCAVSGPDCVRATPLNPNPPSAPAVQTVTDPETGGRLNVTWSTGNEPDLKSVTLWWGTTSGGYDHSIVLGKAATMSSLTGLTNGQRVYVAVTATNTSNLTSGYSPEASGVPTWIRGVKAPGFISTLRVSRSGGDALLTWSAVTTDIYGKAETVANYEVYRGTTPDFLPSPGNRIGVPATPTFTDEGAIAAPATYHYLVRAVDNQGNVGGLGRQLPNGTDVLLVNPSATPGNVVLSWPAVTTDFDGNATTIVRYDVYGASTPFSRDAIRNQSISVVGTSTTPSVEIVPLPGSQYYSVLAVDARGNLSPF